MTEVIARARIAAQAREAARAWVANPKMPQPPNPYPAWSEAARQWGAEFESQLLLFSSPASKGAA